MYDNQNQKTPKIGDVFMVMLDGTGSEQKGWRPAVIFQNNIGNYHSPNVIVLPMTSKLKKVNQPTHVLIRAKETGLKLDSMVLCENPLPLSKSKLGPYVTTLPDKYMSELAQAHLLATSAIAFIDPEVIISLRDKALKMNDMKQVRAT